MIISRSSKPPNIGIHFHGPYLLCAQNEDILETCAFAQSYGLYLWAVKLPTGIFRVTYIGETGTSFYRRTKEHLIQSFGGNYLVYDPKPLEQGERVDLWRGLWRKGTRTLMPEFVKRYEELAPNIKKSLLIQRIFLAPTDVEQSLRQMIESMIAHRIRQNPVALLPDDIRYVKMKASVQTHITVEISTDATIEDVSGTTIIL